MYRIDPNIHVEGTRANLKWKLRSASTSRRWCEKNVAWFKAKLANPVSNRNGQHLKETTIRGYESQLRGYERSVIEYEKEIESLKADLGRPKGALVVSLTDYRAKRRGKP